MTQCNGMNCGTTTGNHSPECRAEHAAAVAGGRFVKGRALTVDDIQRKSIEYGFQYWRASDAHGVAGNSAQAVQLLQDLIGVEVDIEDAPESQRRTKEPITGEWMKRRDGEDLETWSLRVSFRKASEEMDALRQALGMQEDCDYGEMVEMIATLRAEALEEAAEAIDSMNDSAGDHASYDNRQMTCCELSCMHSLSAAAERIRALAASEPKKD